ncbi:MAG TPA: hypothetical protein VKA80_04415 [Beijerinckiaceae bacterium]|nr:hypothetical protein [Beijerinckiaceae bacterium]
MASLAGLQERWNEERGAILKQEGAKEGRLTSVRASLALSLKSPRMAGQPLARACWPCSPICPPAWRRAT